MTIVQARMPIEGTPDVRCNLVFLCLSIFAAIVSDLRAISVAQRVPCHFQSFFLSLLFTFISMPGIKQATFCFFSLIENCSKGLRQSTATPASSAFKLPITDRKLVFLRRKKQTNKYKYKNTFLNFMTMIRVCQPKLFI